MISVYNEVAWENNIYFWRFMQIYYWYYIQLFEGLNNWVPDDSKVNNSRWNDHAKLNIQHWWMNKK